MSDGSDFDVGDDLISTEDIEGLVCVSDGERVLQGNRGDSVALDKSPINATDLGSGVDNGGSSDSVQGGRGDDDGDGNIQGVLSTILRFLNDEGGN